MLGHECSEVCSRPGMGGDRGSCGNEAWGDSTVRGFSRSDYLHRTAVWPNPHWLGLRHVPTIASYVTICNIHTSGGSHVLRTTLVLCVTSVTAFASGAIDSVPPAPNYCTPAGTGYDGVAGLILQSAGGSTALIRAAASFFPNPSGTETIPIAGRNNTFEATLRNTGLEPTRYPCLISIPGRGQPSIELRLQVRATPRLRVRRSLHRTR